MKEAIFSLIKTNEFTLDQISSIMAWHKDFVKDVLNNLEGEGKIKKIYKGLDVVWKVS